MTLDPEFLQMLVCPASRKPLHELPADALRGLNDAILRGVVKNRSGNTVSAVLIGALRPQGEAYVFPIQDGIPILLTTEAIPLDAVAVHGNPGAR
ncbi:MAG: hypothetical protein NT107_14295 [Planctomycetota bacterium]|nr:hypothetical protein [Planctomycetota bacterium]MSR37464.1 hypothetical protein [Planctomycetota bacterium]